MKVKNQLLEQTVKLEIPNNVVEKIQKLCSIISHVEWSGILLYTMEGSFTKPETVVLTAKDIIPMHKGTATYTEFNYNEKKRDNSGIQDRHIDYVTENEEAETWRLGLIHSHNNMNTYFSGVDVDELAENTPTYINFLSLIVNNKMEFEARVSFMGSAEGFIETSYTALDEFGQPYTFAPTKIKSRIEKMFMYPCEIICDTTNNPYDNIFDKAVSEILAEADAPKVNNLIRQPIVAHKPLNQEVINPFVGNLSRKERTHRLNLEEGLYDEETINILKNYLCLDEEDAFHFTVSDLLQNYKDADYPVDFVAYLFDEIVSAEESDMAYTQDEIENIAEESLDIFERFEIEVPSLSKNIVLLRKFIKELKKKDLC